MKMVPYLRRACVGEAMTKEQDNSSLTTVWYETPNITIKELRDEIERLTAVKAAAKEVVAVMDCATSSAKARRLSIINLRAALEPKS